VKRLVLLLCILVFFSSVFAKEKIDDNNFSREILKLYSEMIIISRLVDNFNSEDFVIFEKSIADAIMINSSFYQKNKEYSDFYTKKDKNGMTPLMLASFLGFSNIVQSLLLTSDDPKRDLRMKDKNGFTAYDLANLAESQTYIACDLDIFLINKSIFLNSINYKFRNFYSPNKDNSYLGNYKKISISMEYYGAKFDNNRTRENFRKFCKISNFFSKEFNSSDDIQSFMILLNEQVLNGLNINN